MTAACLVGGQSLTRSTAANLIHSLTRARYSRDAALQAACASALQSSYNHGAPIVAMTTETKNRTITLTDRRPVTIVEADWPCVARTKWYEGEHEHQANRRGHLTVRQHADGRAIVYGTYTSQFLQESDLSGGEIVASGDDLPEAINRVAASISLPNIAQDCIADLPAEQL